MPVFLLIDHIMDGEKNKFLCQSTKRKIDTCFTAPDRLMYVSSNCLKKHDHETCRTLKSVFEQQFTIIPEKTVLHLENERVKAKSI